MKRSTFFVFSSLLFIINSKYFSPTIHNALSQQYLLDTKSGVSSLIQEYVITPSASSKRPLKQGNMRYQRINPSGSSETHHVVLSDKNYRPNSQRTSQESNQLSDPGNTSYTLAKAAITSAGIFDGDVLIRTLWNNEKRSAGTYDLLTAWDGKDDDGNYVADKEYTVRVVSNNVTYDWLRPIGNTSDSATGSSVHHAMQQITNMVQVGNEMYYAVGYNEIGQVHSKFSIGAPNQVKTTLRGGGQVIRFLATDGNIVYSAGQRDGTATFITGIVPNPTGTDVLASFSSGTPYSMATGSPYTYSAFDITDNSDYITGLAVQQTEDYLFASHKTLNQVRVFNKTTGALVQTITGITAPRELAISGSMLWMISETNTVAKYTINSDGILSRTNLTLSGITDPLSVAISPDGSRVAVADRGTYNQLKVFDTSTGALLGTLGRTEDYTNPTVHDDKFYFNNTRLFREDNYGTTHAFVQFQSDGSIWVGDYGNMRCQHFSATGSYIDNIQYMGYSYSCQADMNNPTRVFSDFLEFNVDYSTGSWKFVKNWSKNITIPRDYDEDRMRSVTTLSNGRTYCQYNALSPGSAKEILELDPETGIRHTGLYMDNFNSELNADGSQWQMGNNALGSPAYWKRKPLTGFDSNNNPQWGTYVTVEKTPDVALADPLTADGYLKREQQTSTGVIVTFSSDNGRTKRGRGYHLGGFKNGQWVFKTSPSTRPDYLGDFPNDGAFDIGNQVEYAGTFMQVVDQNIFWGYNGEFWKGSQTNMYNHYLDNGLMVGQFGALGDAARSDDQEVVAGAAGNARSGTYVKIGDDIHFFHCDEGQHAGIHHWKIGNLSSIQTQSFTIPKTGKVKQLSPFYIDLMAGLPESGMVTSGTGRWTYAPDSYNRGTYDLWKVQAGLSTYKRDERSLRFSSYHNANELTREGYCDLTVTPGAANNCSAWQITGRLTYPEISEPYDNFIDVVDNSGKIIVRFSRPESYPNAAVQVNSKTIVSGRLDHIMAKLFQSAQDMSIRRSGDAIIVSYASYPEVSVTAFDPEANLNSPTSLRIHFYSADTHGHQIDLGNFRFYPALTVVKGTGAGLTGQYFNNKTLSEPSTAVRTDPTVNFNWDMDSPLPGQLNVDDFSARWSGQVQAPVSGAYVFSTNSDDGVRLWLNGVQVINNWTDHGPTIDNSASIPLTAGQKYDIRLEYYDGGQGAIVQLWWAYPGQSRQVIPRDRLYSTTSTAETGTGIYLSDLAWTSAANGYGPVERDRSNGENGGNDGRTIILNGVTYAKGLGAHAPSAIVYKLGGRYTRFLSEVGIDDERSDNVSGSVIFRVYTDDILVYDSGVMSTTSATKSINVDVTNKRTLKLVIDSNGNNGGDHGDWAGARVIPAGNARIGVVEHEDTDPIVKIHPVPTKSDLWIQYYAKEAGELSIKLINVLAQPVHQSAYQVTQGENTLKIPVEGFARGVYLLNLTQGYRRASRRVILSDQ